jgi:hypothetical protein
MHFQAEQAADDIASPKLTKMTVTVLTFSFRRPAKQHLKR